MQASEAFGTFGRCPAGFIVGELDSLLRAYSPAQPAARAFISHMEFIGAAAGLIQRIDQLGRQSRQRPFTPVHIPAGAPGNAAAYLVYSRL